MVDCIAREHLQARHRWELNTIYTISSFTLGNITHIPRKGCFPNFRGKRRAEEAAAAIRDIGGGNNELENDNNNPELLSWFPPKTYIGHDDATDATIDHRGVHAPVAAAGDGLVGDRSDGCHRARDAAQGSAPPIPYAARRGQSDARSGQQSWQADRTGKLSSRGTAGPRQ